MNCPKCQKPLPKSYPRVCPNCKKDLGNFYQMKETKERLEAEKAKAAKRKTLIAIIAAVLICVVIAAVVLIPKLTAKDPPDGTGSSAEEAALDMTKVKAEINSKQVSDFTESAEPTDYVKITVRDFGELVVKLRPDAAPLSVENFKKLVQQGYYTGSKFHRIYPGFMIQGGAGETELEPIKGEFQANGVDNPLLHVRGVISMARTTQMDSATSQFFLMHADYPSLNGNYAAFGYIVAGLEIVDRICEQTPLGDNPYNGEHSVPQVDVVIESVSFVKPVA